MFELLPLVILLVSGICGVAFGLFRLSKYGVVISSLLFLSSLFVSPRFIKIPWLSIHDFEISFSFHCSQTSVLLCALISSILSCLYFARSLSSFDASIERKFGILNIFVFFMCLAILSDNIFQFYIGVEALGLISSLLIVLEKNAHEEFTRVFMFNKFASITFLIAISMIVIQTGSFDIASIKGFCLSKGANKLFFPACLLLIACFCKGAQLPFSYWLLDAVKANVFASILIHSGTIVAVGIIFITKFYFLFNHFPILNEVMLLVGLYTSIWMECCALAHNDIKKIIACLTCSAAGLMFMSCGLGGYSLAILYFICHAFYKSLLFLSFAYLIFAMSGERSLLHMGGISKLAPKVTDIVWASFLFASGFPFLSGFFVKISFVGTVDLAHMEFLNWSSSFINVIAIAAMFRMIFKALYGESSSDDLTLSRSVKSNNFNMKPFWLLSSISLFGSFTIWSIFEWGYLHFGYPGIVYIRMGNDYFVGTISAVLQIVIAIGSVLLFYRYPNIISQRDRMFITRILKNNEIYRFSFNIIQIGIIGIMRKIANFQGKLERFCSLVTFKTIYNTGRGIALYHERSFNSHILWIIVGVTLTVVALIFPGE